jgi:hypothetical protein
LCSRGVTLEIAKMPFHHLPDIETMSPEQGAEPAGHEMHPPRGSGFRRRAFTRAKKGIMPTSSRCAMGPPGENLTTARQATRPDRSGNAGNPPWA